MKLFRNLYLSTPRLERQNLICDCTTPPHTRSIKTQDIGRLMRLQQHNGIKSNSVPMHFVRFAVFAVIHCSSTMVENCQERAGLDKLTTAATTATTAARATAATPTIAITATTATTVDRWWCFCFSHSISNRSFRSKH